MSTERSLTILLSRLEQKLSNSPCTVIECTKITANVEYARKLLLQLESDTRHHQGLGVFRQQIRIMNEKLRKYESEIQLPEEENESEQEGELPHEDHIEQTLRIRKVSAPSQEHMLAHHRQQQEQLSDNLLQMAGTLRDNTVQFNEKLEKDSKVVDATGRLLERNSAAMSKTGGSLNKYSKQSGSTFWLLIGVTLAAIVLFFFVVALIAIT